MLRSNKFLVILMIFTSFYLHAEEIDIESIPSLEGASLYCFKNNKKDLSLGIYGETRRTVISISKKDNYLYLSDKEIYYSNILGTGEKMIDVLEISKNSYFFKGKPLSGPSLPTAEMEKSQESYNLLKSALDEAHSQGKCMNWKL